MNTSSMLSPHPVLLYGFARAGDWNKKAITDLAKQPGLFGSPISVTEYMGVLAHTEVLSSLDVPRSRNHAINYGAIIETRLHRNSPFIPCRFTTVLSSREVLHSILQQRSWALSALLDQIVARQEYALRIYYKSTYPDAFPFSAHEGSGSDSSVSFPAVSVIASAIAACSFWSKKESGSSGSLLYRGSFLIDDSRIAECLTHLKIFQESNPHLSLLFLGPFPPYAYVAHAMGSITNAL